MFNKKNIIIFITFNIISFIVSFCLYYLYDSKKGQDVVFIVFGVLLVFALLGYISFVYKEKLRFKKLVKLKEDMIIDSKRKYGKVLNLKEYSLNEIEQSKQYFYYTLIPAISFVLPIIILSIIYFAN